MAMARAPLPTSRRMAASASSSLSSTTTCPLQSTRSLTSAMSVFGTRGSGLLLSGKCRTFSLARPGTPRAPRMMWMTSRWPLVVISPTRAPRRWSSALVPTVVPRARRAVRRSSASVESPSLSAASASESSTPWEKSCGVDGALAVTMRPSPSTTTQSVKVPPVSIPQMKSPVVATLLGSWLEIRPASTCDGARGSSAASACCSAAPSPSAIHVFPAHGRGQRGQAPPLKRAVSAAFRGSSPASRQHFECAGKTWTNADCTEIAAICRQNAVHMPPLSNSDDRAIDQS